MSPRLAWLALAALPLAVAAQAPQPPLTSVAAVRRLDPASAASRRPVQLAGVVTHFNPAAGDFYLQDDAGGVYVHPQTRVGHLDRGDRVQLAGVTEAAATVRVTGDLFVLGRAPPPEPAPCDLSRQGSRWLDAQEVSVWATVAAAEPGRLRVVTPQGDGVVVVAGGHPAAELAALVGRGVRVRGVLAAQFKHGEVADAPVIYSAALPVVWADPEPEPVAWAARFADLLRYAPGAHPAGRLVRLKGRVAGRVLPRLVCVQDDSAGVSVELIADTAAGAGDAVEVTGRLAVEGRRLILREARLTPADAPAMAPQPHETSAAELAAGRHHARLVRVDAELVEVRPIGPSSCALTLADGGTRFEARANHEGGPCPAAAGHPPGTRVRCTGVATHLPASGGWLFTLHPDGGLELPDLPPNAPIPQRFTATHYLAATAAALALLAAAAWAWRRLRRTPPAADPAQFRVGNRPLAVLLVEDDDIVRELARNILAFYGCTIHVTDGPAAALDLARTHPGPLDLVLTDVMMPDMNGRELADRLRPLLPGVRVLYMSGRVGDEAADPARPFRDAEFLPKPFKADQLAAKMRGLLGEA